MITTQEGRTRRPVFVPGTPAVHASVLPGSYGEPSWTTPAGGSRGHARAHLHWNRTGGRPRVKRLRLFRGTEGAGEASDDPKTAALRRRLSAVEAALEALSEGIVVVDAGGGID